MFVKRIFIVCIKNAGTEIFFKTKLNITIIGTEPIQGITVV